MCIFMKSLVLSGYRERTAKQKLSNKKSKQKSLIKLFLPVQNMPPFFITA